MSKILYIGKYYPLFSYESKQTEIIVKKLKKKGNEIILLSKSWCDVNESNFYGSIESLTSNEPFLKKYYVDPLQVHISKLNIFNAYFGLACKVIEYEEIEEIIFADDISYSILIELIKKRYNIPCFLFLFKISSIKEILDNYMISYIVENLMIFDKIYTLSIFKDFLEKELEINDKKIEEVIPFEIQNMKKNINVNNNCIYLWCKNFSAMEVEKFIFGIKKKTKISEEKIYVIYPEKKDKYKFNGIYIENVPKSSLVIFENENLNCGPIDYSYIFTVLACGFIPVINGVHLKGLENYDKEYLKIGELYAVTKLGLNQKPVDEVYK